MREREVMISLWSITVLLKSQALPMLLLWPVFEELISRKRIERIRMSQHI